MTSSVYESDQGNQVFKPLETSRLVIRTFAPEDGQALLAYKLIPEAVEYQGWHPQSIAEVDAFLLQNQLVMPNTPGTWLQIAICLKESGALIGDIGLHFLEDGQQLAIGYTLSPLHWGKGYATEAVTAAINYLFHRLGKHRITASVDPRNTHSSALLERIGMRKEAYFVKSYLDGNIWLDDVVYAILEDEWQEKHPEN